MKHACSQLDGRLNSIVFVEIMQEPYCAWHHCSGVARVFSLLLAIPQALRPHKFRLIETTVLVVQPRWSVGVQIVRTWRSGSSRLRPLSGYAQNSCSPLMGRKPKSADLLKRASQQTSSIDKYFEQTSPGRQLSEANAYVCNC